LHQIAYLVVGSQQIEPLNFAVFGLVTRSLLTSLRPVLEPDEEEESWLILQQLPWQQLLQLHRHHPEQNWQNTNIE